MAEGNEARKRGGRYCVAGAPNDVSCTNSTFTNGIRMHQFPSNPVVRRQWVKFVQRHRHDFREPLSKYTSLCSAHFESSCYERKYIGLLISESKMLFILRKGAVPTIDSVSLEREEILTERDKRQVSLVYSLRINSYFVRRYMYMGRDKKQVILVYSL
jgi:hypothetical protein